MDMAVAAKNTNQQSPEVSRRAYSNKEIAKEALSDIAAQFEGFDTAIICLFISPQYRSFALAEQILQVFGEKTVYACTTAGELFEGGYSEASITAFGLEARYFDISPVFFENISEATVESVTGRVLEAKRLLTRSSHSDQNDFAMLLVDGLTKQEDRLLTYINPVLGSIPLFGGSAADGLDFNESQIYANGKLHRDAALLLLVRTECRRRVFQFAHFKPTGIRMVGTRADRDNRILYSINDEPAGPEYARLVGKDPDALSEFVFAENPVAVNIGGRSYVRAIQQVREDGSLQFFCAIDEGMVLNLAEPEDIYQHLSDSLATLYTEQSPQTIIAFDCILRRLVESENAINGDLSKLISQHPVVGFNTYGEQLNIVHVNQTFTGLALYPPVESA